MSNSTSDLGPGEIPIVGSGIKSIKESDRKRTKEVTHRKFNSIEDMADNIYAKSQDAIEKEVETDKEKGFDINDINSILNFKVGYTPVGNTVLIKTIKGEEKVGNIIIPDNSTRGTKAVVIVPGMLVTMLRKGDIILYKATLEGSVASVERIFNGVKFHEIDYYAIAGVMKDIDEMNERVKDMWENYKK